MDFDFLRSQTFADEALERDLLELFVAQTQRILSTISTLDAVGQAEKAHHLKGSARSIGAWAVAEAASRYEAAEPRARQDLLPVLSDAVEATEQAINARLSTLEV